MVGESCQVADETDQPAPLQARYAELEAVVARLIAESRALSDRALADRVPSGAGRSFCSSEAPTCRCRLV